MNAGDQDVANDTVELRQRAGGSGDTLSWSRSALMAVPLLLLAVAGLTLAIRSWRVLPLWDQWETVSLYQRWLDGGWTGAHLAAQHNEHRHLLANLVFLGDYTFFRATSVLAWTVLIAVQLALGLALGGFTTRGEPRPIRVLGLVLGVALIASPVQIDNLILPFHVSIPLVCLLALLAFFATAQAATASGPRTWIDAGLACVLVGLCPYAMANGIIASLMAGVLALVLGGPRLPALAIAAAAVAAVASFFWGWTLPPHHVGLLASASGLAGVWQIPTHTLLLIGTPGMEFGAEGAGVAGLIGVALWLMTLYRWWRSRPQRSVNAATVALLMLATFSLGTAVMIASGRAGAGIWQALSIRYATFSLVFWMSLLGAMWRLRPQGSSATRDRRVILAAAAALLALCYGAWFRGAAVWRAQVAISERITADLRAGRFNRADIALIFPDPDRLIPSIAFLRQRQLSIFARP